MILIMHLHMHTARPEVHQTNAIIYPHGTVIRSSTNL